MIVGKAPRPGATKTRLVPPLTPEHAADLYRAFLLDTTHLACALDWDRVSVVHPRGHGQELGSLLDRRVHLVEQGGHGLADALVSALAAHFSEGFERVVLLGSDSPTLPLDAIHDACSALDSSDVSIGRTADGGYYLLGMRALHAALFDQIEWSTARVYRQTLQRAKRVGLRVHTVAGWYDVDEPADLDRLRLDLVERPMGVAENTRAALSRFFSGAVGVVEQEPRSGVARVDPVA